jgi:hypothetical protein
MLLGQIALWLKMLDGAARLQMSDTLLATLLDFALIPFASLLDLYMNTVICRVGRPINAQVN